MLSTFLSGLFLFLPLLHWSGTYVGWPPWVILAIGEAAIFSLAGLLFVKSNFVGAIQFSSLFLLIELLRMKWPFGGFGWGRIGFTQTDSLARLYPVFSVAGITLLTALISTLFIVALKRTFVFTLLFYLLTFLPQSYDNSGSVNVFAVQGGVDRLGLDFNKRALAVLNRHAAETMKIKEKSDLVVWPENASDLDPFVNVQAKLIISKVIAKIQSPLLVGAVESRLSGPQNSSLLYDSVGNLSSRYIKQDLAPFGEYIPLRSISEKISNEAKNVKDFQPGSSWVRHSIGKTTFASIICFEILDDDHIRDGARGTEFLVAQTNNATFGRSWQSAQQLQITQARAAELRKSFVVVSTTGFTAQISPDGAIVKKLEPFIPGSLKMKVVKMNVRTPASNISTTEWIAFSLALLGLTRIRRFSR